MYQSQFGGDVRFDVWLQSFKEASRVHKGGIVSPEPGRVTDLKPGGRMFHPEHQTRIFCELFGLFRVKSSWEQKLLHVGSFSNIYEKCKCPPPPP